MKIFKIALLVLFITSCSSINVNYDYERGTDFTKYKTYNYYSDLETGMNELDSKRFIEALDTKLQAKGHTKSETPDFFINIQSNEFQEAQQSSSVGVGVGGGGGNVGGGISVGIPIGQSNINRRIVIDFIDENGNGLFWQAISDSGYNPKSSPEKRKASLIAIAEKVLLQYPPEQKLK